MASDNGCRNSSADNAKALSLKSLQEGALTTTSTLAYRHEPFETYRHRILATANAVFTSQSEPTVIYRMTGGGYNRICGITVKTSDKQDDYVYRTPRSRDPVDRSARMLRYLENHPQVPTPRVIAEQLNPSPIARSGTGLDQSTANGECQAGEAYIIMEKLPGKPLVLVYADFTFTQKMSMAVQIANLMADIFSIPVPSKIGHLQVDEEGHLTVIDFIHKQMLPAKTEHNYLEPAQGDIEDGPAILPSFRKLFDYMNRAKKLEDPQNPCDWRIYRKLVNSVELLLSPLSQHLSEFSYCVLLHGDLAGRNILVTDPDDKNGVYSISGVLDWDDCLALPPLAAYWSPNWLWEEYDNGPTESFRLGAEFDADPDELPQSSERQAIRQAFIQAIEARISNYMEIVRMGRKARVKQMLYVAQYGIFNPFIVKTVDDIYQAAGLPTLFGSRQSSICYSEMPNSIVDGSDTEFGDDRDASGSHGVDSVTESDSTTPKSALSTIPAATKSRCSLSPDADPTAIPLPVSLNSTLGHTEIPAAEVLCHEAACGRTGYKDGRPHSKDEKEDMRPISASSSSPAVTSHTSSRKEAEEPDIPNCLSTIGQWFARRRAVRKEKLAKRRQKMLGAVQYLGQAIMHFTS